MNNAAVYLIVRLFNDLAGFLRHWYLDSFRAVGGAVINLLERLDERLALRITLRNFFRPLFGDQSLVGRILGICFRVLRVALALIIYPLLVIGGAALYFVWAAIPFLIIFNSFR